MIQDIFPYKMNNQYDSEAVASFKDHVLVFEEGKLLVSKEGLEFPRVSDFESGEFRYLFTISDERFFLSTAGMTVPENCEFKDLREIRGKAADYKHHVFAAYTGKHLYDWYNITQFCGKCGSKMVHSDTERAMVCENCGNTVYPRIMPAVIVGVTNGDKLLLTRYRTGYGHNALVAGFTEIGETVEETVEREVFEETGLKVKNIRYYKSQPWGIVSDLLMGFYCDVDGSDEIVMDENELKYASWVQRDEIELQPDDISLTNEMMKMFKENRNN